MLANLKGLAISLWWPRPVSVLLSSDVALIGEPGSGYYALIKAAFSLFARHVCFSNISDMYFVEFRQLSGQTKT